MEIMDLQKFNHRTYFGFLGVCIEGKSTGFLFRFGMIKIEVMPFVWKWGWSGKYHWKLNAGPFRFENVR